MAEVFGTVAGALSVAALFNNCGEAVAINDDPRFATHTPDDGDSRQKSSKRYEIDARQDDLVRFEDKDMQPVVRGLHGRLGVVARQRQKRTCLLKKAAWALYDGKNFDKLVEQTTGFVDDLEKLFPVESMRRKLVELEIEEVDDKLSLMALQDAAASTESVLSEAVIEKIEGIAGRNYTKDIKSEEMARVRVGNEWSETALARGTSIADRTANLADSVDAKVRPRYT
ncbi:hypothetical protein EDB81DRAFT_873261 [Dactylonectria macrodidyma]|uniref:Prion-inhibition and propagation HeLo domain-containing protein n=1 Tax=Dactylonectria macrodidyma TaxID=307937 RepID=A0A9P9DDW9_9HYPO|nr:hypothetical protein EDB81DRAFT_873261 [Dactylonectria macrodidyma]